MGVIYTLIVLGLALAVLISILWERKERKRPRTIKIHFKER